MSSHPRLVIGLGTGRCGTLSLGKLFDLQPHARGCHELFEFNLAVSGPDCAAHLAALPALAAGADCRSFCDVNLAYLWHVEALLEIAPETRFLCLQRERAGTVRSFERKAGPRNHWMAHDGIEFRSDPWDRCFPKYQAASREEAIGRYWDDYSARSAALARAHPERFRVFPMEDLNSEAGQRRLLAFAGFEPADLVLAPGLRENIGQEPRK